MDYNLLLRQEAIGATKRFGIILGLFLALIVSISLFHVLRELQGLPYNGGPLFDSYVTFYDGVVAFAVGTFVVMCGCFSLHNTLVGNQQKTVLWLVLMIITMAMWVL